MWAIGELLVYAIYFAIGLACIIFLLLAFTSKKLKLKNSVASAFFCLLFFGLMFRQKQLYRNSQLDKVGIYYLTNNPKCELCYLELKEDMTYTIINKGEVIEKSNWHFESGGDYWITYLDNDKSQLGFGNYEYKHYKQKYSGRVN